MKLKAAECGLILVWVVDALERLGGSVPFCEDLCAAGHCFCAYLDCIRSQPEIIPLDVQQHMFDLMQSAILRCNEAEIEAAPKVHFFYHMTDRCLCCMPMYTVFPRWPGLLRSLQLFFFQDGGA